MVVVVVAGWAAKVPPNAVAGSGELYPSGAGGGTCGGNGNWGKMQVGEQKQERPKVEDNWEPLDPDPMAGKTRCYTSKKQTLGCPVNSPLFFLKTAADRQIEP